MMVCNKMSTRKSAAKKLTIKTLIKNLKMNWQSFKTDYKKQIMNQNAKNLT